MTSPILTRSPFILDALAASDCETVRHWRNRDDVRMGLRTPYMLTHDMQARFYQQVVSDARSRHRYWALRDPMLVGMAGLTDIEWENGHAEISLLLDPTTTGKGLGAEAVGLVLAEAFQRLRLVTVFGEVYAHNPARAFWSKMLKRYSIESNSVVIPRRKYWAGSFHDGIMFWFTAETFKGVS